MSTTTAVESMRTYRLHDGPAMWATGPAEPLEPGPATTGVAIMGEFTDLLRDSEIYRMRNRGDLYDTAESDTMQDWRERASDLWDLDCHRCKVAVLVPALDSPCPHCGGPTA